MLSSSTVQVNPIHLPSIVLIVGRHGNLEIEYVPTLVSVSDGHRHEACSENSRESFIIILCTDKLVETPSGRPGQCAEL